MARNIRGRVDKLEADTPTLSIRWNALFTGDLGAFLASLPDPPQTPPARDYVEERMAAMEAQARSGGTDGHGAQRSDG